MSIPLNLMRAKYGDNGGDRYMMIIVFTLLIQVRKLTTDYEGDTKTRINENEIHLEYEFKRKS